jgi:hypothetical protein
MRLHREILSKSTGVSAGCCCISEHFASILPACSPTHCSRPCMADSAHVAATRRPQMSGACSHRLFVLSFLAMRRLKSLQHIRKPCMHLCGQDTTLSSAWWHLSRKPLAVRLLSRPRCAVFLLFRWHSSLAQKLLCWIQRRLCLFLPSVSELPPCWLVIFPVRVRIQANIRRSRRPQSGKEAMVDRVRYVQLDIETMCSCSCVTRW